MIYALFISPPDYIQGDSVRIMYVHVPSSLISLGCFAFIGVASILNLINNLDRDKLWSTYSLKEIYFFIKPNCQLHHGIVVSNNE